MLFSIIPDVCVHFLCVFIVLQDLENLTELQHMISKERKLNVCDNVAVIVFRAEALDGDSNTDLIEALDGKFDALRDKLLAEALLKQVIFVSPATCRGGRTYVSLFWQWRCQR